MNARASPGTIVQVRTVQYHTITTRAVTTYMVCGVCGKGDGFPMPDRDERISLSGTGTGWGPLNTTSDPVVAVLAFRGGTVAYNKVSGTRHETRAGA